MSVKGELPGELLDFLKMEGGHSLIIHGDAGTGKTTLALQLIEALDGEQNTIYMSTRVSDHSLYLQFPWLRDRVYRNRLLMDAKSFLRSISDRSAQSGIQSSAHALLQTLYSKKAYEMPESISRVELKKLEGDIEGIEEESEMYDEGSLVFDLGSDMPEIDLAYDSVESALPKRSLVVFDSIDALSEKYGVPANRLVMTIQKDLVENSAANVIYVMESAEAGHLDYLGDGVIYIKTGELNGRRYREIIISKLRGYEIEQHRHIISLSGGRITDLSQIARTKGHTGERREWKPYREFQEGNRYSTGTPDLDELLGGGLSQSSAILIEVSSEATREFVDEIVFRMVETFALNEHGVSWLPSRSMSRQEVSDRIGKDLPFESIEQNIKVFEHGRGESLNRQLGVALEGKDVQTDMDWAGVEYSLKGRKVPFLSVIGMDTLKAVYGMDAPLGIFEHIGAVKKAKGIFLMVVSGKDEQLSRLSSIADYHIVVDMVHSAPVLYGIKPFTHLYGIQLSPEESGVIMKLVPIS